MIEAPSRHSAVGVALARDGESAQADIAPFQRRIHSLLIACGVRTFAVGVALARDGESAQADFVWLLRRIHSLGWGCGRPFTRSRSEPLGAAETPFRTTPGRAGVHFQNFPPI